MASTVIVVGGKNLRRTLKQAARDIKQLRSVNQAAAEIVAAAAKAAAPKGKTGRLAASVKAGRATNRSGRVEYGRGLPYAGPIHWGWPARGIEAQPFVSEAAQATESQWMQLYQKHVDDVLDKVKGA